MKFRTALPAALAVAVLAGTAACSSGDRITTEPKNQAPASTRSSKAAPAKSQAPRASKVGDTIALNGMTNGSKLDVTVVKVSDPAVSADEYSTPAAGHRYVGVQFRLVNSGPITYSDSPGNGVQIADVQGQQFTPTYADIKAGPSMASDLRLLPGRTGLGWIVFEVPKASKITAVQFTMDSGFAEQTGQWSIG